MRLLDPARAEFYARSGLRVVCPTRDAIDVSTDAVARARSARRQSAGLMYVLIAGGGKVGANLARTLLRAGHEVTLIEQRRDRFERARGGVRAPGPQGDATELFVLERAGIKRPPDIVARASPATTRTTSSSASSRSEQYGVEKVIARVNDPRNQAHFDLLGISPTVCATSSIMALIEHEVPEHELVHLLELRKENLEIVEVQIDEGSPVAGKRSSSSSCPTARA